MGMPQWVVWPRGRRHKPAGRRGLWKGCGENRGDEIKTGGGSGQRPQPPSLALVGGIPHPTGQAWTFNLFTQKGFGGVCRQELRFTKQRIEQCERARLRCVWSEGGSWEIFFPRKGEWMEEEDGGSLAAAPSSLKVTDPHGGSTGARGLVGRLGKS